MGTSFSWMNPKGPRSGLAVRSRWLLPGARPPPRLTPESASGLPCLAGGMWAGPPCTGPGPGAGQNSTESLGTPQDPPPVRHPACRVACLPSK